MIGTAGSAVDFAKDLGIFENYEGDYEIRLFVEDRRGFIHSSAPAKITITPMDNSKLKFSDVTAAHWASDSVYRLTISGLVKGYTDSTFRPENSITRAEFMAFLIRTLKDSKLTTDVNGTDWFTKEGYKNTAVQLGLIKAYRTADYYNKNITRGEMARMIYTLMAYQGEIVEVSYQSKLTDVSSSSYMKEITVCEYYGIINGYPDMTFNELKTATRAEAMKIIAKYLEIISI